MSILWSAAVSHDNLKKGKMPEGKRKVLIYVAEGNDEQDAEAQLRGLESQFQGLNSEIRILGPVSTVHNHPLLMGTLLESV